MHYTVAVLEDLEGRIKVNFDKCGNQYLVGVYNKENEEYTFKKYDDILEAQEMFCRLAGAIVTGCYSYEQRKSWLR